MLQNQFINSISKSINNNGLIDTIKILNYYRKLRRSNEAVLSLQLASLATPVNLRPGTSDFSVFRQIMMDYEYSFAVDDVPKTIIDAGANIGLASLYFSNRFPDSHIFAIEPDESNFEMLIKNVSKTRVTAIQAALWKSNGELSFVDDPTVDKWGLRVQSTNVSARKVKAIDVRSIMRDYQLETIDLFKIDIEGSEYEVFSEGASEWLIKTRLIAIELHENLRPRCSKIFHEALAAIPHETRQYGENLIVRNLNFK